MLTLADARAYLWPHITTNGANDASVLGAINDAQERFINSGHWRGGKEQVIFSSPSAYITLPRRFESVLGLRFENTPQLVYSQYHTYVSGGPGALSDSTFNMNSLVDLGVGFACNLDISANATLRVKIEDSGDVSKTIWLKGEDANGRIIFNSSGVEGVSVTTVNPSVDTTQVFSKLTGFQKPVTEGYVTLWQVISGVETQIGAYEPGETVADYHRYQVGSVSTNRPTSITALCKRKFVPAIQETDLIYPGNRGAMKLACIALNYETQNDMGRSEQYWQKAMQLLNQETSQSRGAAQQRQLVSPHGLKLHSIRRGR